MLSEEKLLFRTEKPVEFLKVYPYASPNFLLAVGFDYEIRIYECMNVEKDGHTDEINCLESVRLPSLVKQLSWSPDTSLQSAPQIIKFFTASSDNKVRCISSDLKNSREEIVVGEHGSFVNSVAVHPEKGSVVASTADDNLCCIWMVEEEKVITFDLTSPGMSVCWNPKELNKLMVAEKCGVIRFYSIETKHAFMSLDCGHNPLLHAHWSPLNPLDVAAIAGTNLFVFDTSLSSQAQLVQKMHPGGGKSVTWCPSNEKFLITAGGPRFQVKVLAVKTLQMSTFMDLKAFGSIDVHPVMPLVYVSSDNEIKIFPVIS